MRGYVPPLPFGAVLALLGVATVVGVGVAEVVHRPVLVPVVLGAALVVGILYIFLTIGREVPPLETASPPDPSPSNTGPLVPTPPPAGTPPAASPSSVETAPVDPVDLDPDYDPVEDADRATSAVAGESARDDPK